MGDENALWSLMCYLGLREEVMSMFGAEIEEEGSAPRKKVKVEKEKDKAEPTKPSEHVGPYIMPLQALAMASLLERHEGDGESVVTQLQAMTPSREHMWTDFEQYLRPSEHDIPVATLVAEAPEEPPYNFWEAACDWSAGRSNDGGGVYSYNATGPVSAKLFNNELLARKGSLRVLTTEVYDNCGLIGDDKEHRVYIVLKSKTLSFSPGFSCSDWDCVNRKQALDMTPPDALTLYLFQRVIRLATSMGVTVDSEPQWLFLNESSAG
jgi:hypothetical protein